MASEEHPEWSERRHRSYTRVRRDVLKWLPPCDGPVLDVGCSNGASGAWLKKSRPGLEVFGIEADPRMAAEAREPLDRVLEGDAASCLRQLNDEGVRLGAVVMADVLEHMVDPWSVFDQAVALVRSGGWVLASLPNVSHWDTVANLLRGRWPYRERGIHDDTHLRFFARRNVEDLFKRPGITLTELHCNYRFVESPRRVNRRAQRLGRVLPDIFVFQFVALGQVR